MTLTELFQQHQSAGYDVVSARRPADALGWFYLALLAFAADDFSRAASFARTAAECQPTSRVYPQAARYLARVQVQGRNGVYVDGDAFAAFIRGGGNIGLYAAVSAALHASYGEYAGLSLLDIGVGDGLALLPALPSHLTRLDLVEPSAAMLERTCTALDARHVPYQATNSTLQDFMQHDAPHWDVIQATWSLQSTAPAERPAIFDWLRAHGSRVLIAEFDVPHFAAMFGPDRVEYVVSRYERGLAEYEGDHVAQGFLMPVLFGYFDRSAARTNWEGPIQGWIEGLRAAGFSTIQARPLFRYFWADAFLIDAR